MGTGMGALAEVKGGVCVCVCVFGGGGVTVASFV